jgi:hypothetical protein
MRRRVWIGAFLLALSGGTWGLAGEPACCEPAEPYWLKRLRPVGGWDPYGGGLLHWWNPHCFPRGGAPDDYDRKKLPCVCWPPYPPSSTWGPPAAAPTVPGGDCRTSPPRH